MPSASFRTGIIIEIREVTLSTLSFNDRQCYTPFYRAKISHSRCPSNKKPLHLLPGTSCLISEKIAIHLPLALSGWLSLRNFGMPGVTGWVTFRGNKHTTLAQLDHMGLTVNGSALPSPKRLRAGRSKVLQENPPYGPGFIFTGI